MKITASTTPPDEDAERERQHDVRPFVEQRLIEQRGLGAFAIHGEERDERERASRRRARARVHLLADELLPLRRLDLRDEPVAHREEHADGDEHRHPFDDLAARRHRARERS